VGGGLMSLISPLYPRSGIDIREHVRALPADGSVPGMAGWRWIHTPGHTPGHVSLFRERDRVLISGDAFITVQQESAIAVMTQEMEVHGPPAYFTTDWAAARESVRALRALHPAAVAPGHGQPMAGEELARELDVLADHFDQVAVPESGRYVHESP
jgi:glyoxylase-like metal-dependent hydrolase (beta-lactamase superfamily II)